jgi:hypothetical protein
MKTIDELITGYQTARPRLLEALRAVDMGLAIFTGMTPEERAGLLFKVFGKGALYFVNMPFVPEGQRPLVRAIIQEAIQCS